MGRGRGTGTGAHPPPPLPLPTSRPKPKGEHGGLENSGRPVPSVPPRLDAGSSPAAAAGPAGSRRSGCERGTGRPSGLAGPQPRSAVTSQQLPGRRAVPGWPAAASPRPRHRRCCHGRCRHAAALRRLHSDEAATRKGTERSSVAPVTALPVASRRPENKPRKWFILLPAGRKAVRRQHV